MLARAVARFRILAERSYSHMCGIVGYIGPREASDVLAGGLSRLEYRGYDSAGMAIISDSELKVVRRVGKLVNLEDVIEETPVHGTIGIGHTRWATHGRPSEDNAHPHIDCTGKIAVVHNGIIENYVELREELAAAGHILRSETDTETVAHLVESYFDGDLSEAVRKATQRLDGSYALGVVHLDYPDTIVAARKDSPLIVGIGEGENIVASDIPAVLEYTREVLVLHDGQVATVTAAGVDVVEPDGTSVVRAGHDARGVGPRSCREGRLRGLHAQGDIRAAQGDPGDAPGTHVGLRARYCSPSWR